MSSSLHMKESKIDYDYICLSHSGRLKKTNQLGSKFATQVDENVVVESVFGLLFFVQRLQLAEMDSNNETGSCDGGC